MAWVALRARLSHRLLSVPVTASSAKTSSGLLPNSETAADSVNQPMGALR
jgi:hypothetical protein